MSAPGGAIALASWQQVAEWCATRTTVTLNQAADALGVSHSTLRRAVEAGTTDLHVTRIGTRYAVGTRSLAAAVGLSPIEIATISGVPYIPEHMGAPGPRLDDERGAA